MKIKSFTFNPFMENTYVLFDETNEGVIIDPGCYDPAEEKELEGFIDKHNINIKYILNTHGHIDHVLGNAFTTRKFNAPLAIGEKDIETLHSVIAYAPNYGFQNYQPVEPNILLKEGDTVNFGDSELNALFVPGHAPGHIAFYTESKSFIIGGDVLFQGSIGRTDLPGGDYDTLISSIKNEFFTFPDETIVYSGHGDKTTIGQERNSNPFLQ